MRSRSTGARPRERILPVVDLDPDERRPPEAPRRTPRPVPRRAPPNRSRLRAPGPTGRGRLPRPDAAARPGSPRRGTPRDRRDDGPRWPTPLRRPGPCRPRASHGLPPARTIAPPPAGPRRTPRRRRAPRASADRGVRPSDRSPAGPRKARAHDTGAQSAGSCSRRAARSPRSARISSISAGAGCTRKSPSSSGVAPAEDRNRNRTRASPGCAPSRSLSLANTAGVHAAAGRSTTRIPP